MNNTKNICSRCVMDDSTLGIVFDDNNICNYCSEFLDRNKTFINISKEKQELEFKNLIETIKHAGKDKKYENGYKLKT